MLPLTAIAVSYSIAQAENLSAVREYLRPETFTPEQILNLNRHCPNLQGHCHAWISYNCNSEGSRTTVAAFLFARDERD